MSSITYISIFAKDIDNYIQFKCSMGYSKSTYDNALKRFDRFCAENFLPQPELKPMYFRRVS